MGRVVPVVLLVAVTIYCLIDAAQSDDEDVRTLPKPFWIVLILLVPVLGPAGWFLLGRPRPDAPSWWDTLSSGRFGTRSGRGPARPGPVAPDDDPEFLARLRRADGEDGHDGRPGGPKPRR